MFGGGESEKRTGRMPEDVWLAGMTSGQRRRNAPNVGRSRKNPWARRPCHAHAKEDAGKISRKEIKTPAQLARAFSTLKQIGSCLMSLTRQSRPSVTSNLLGCAAATIGAIGAGA